jgi:hypothetical protein
MSKTDSFRDAYVKKLKRSTILAVETSYLPWLKMSVAAIFDMAAFHATFRVLAVIVCSAFAEHTNLDLRI